MSLFGTLSNVAISQGDCELAVSIAEQGLKQRGSLVDRHFLYNEIIGIFSKNQEFEIAKIYCLRELDQFPRIGEALKSKSFGILPPSMPCRDTLLRIVVDVEKNYEGAERLIDVLSQKGLLTVKQAQEKTRKLRIQKLYAEGQQLLQRGQFEDARRVFDHIIDIDESQSADIYKTLGNHLKENGRNQEAFTYLQKAVAADPLVTGVRSTLAKLSRNLGFELRSDKEETIKFLREKEKSTTWWWEKRDLGNEYLKMGQHDRAWELFNEAIALRKPMPLDTIYPYIAKMLEKEDRFHDALYHYLLAYKERLNSQGAKVPKYISLGINRCLKKLNLSKFSDFDIYGLVSPETDPGTIRTSLDAFLVL